jgi:predicted MFS family arabinose efflux permease
LPATLRPKIIPTLNPQNKFHFLCYVIEGMNSFAAVIYFNYLYFFFRDQFGFGNQHNLALAALIGLIYAFASWQGGKFAHRFGNFFTLKIGLIVLAVCFFVGAQIHSLPGAILIACVANIGLCCTWPVLEALISEGETPAHVPHAVGIYNITWAVTNALAFFIGGTLIEKSGYRSIFYVPLILILAELALVFYAQKIYRKIPRGKIENDFAAPVLNKPPSNAKLFRRLAWVANPFAYIAINTLLAVLPGVADKFHLSTSLAGFVCSLWCFARLAAFVILWRWTDWHYRFRWLALAFAMLIISFAVILIAPSLPVILLAQLFFGSAVGLIYYSSLYYSMDASETKSEHGGIHEAAIGAGNCIGPAIGAGALFFLPQFPNGGAVAVSALLLCGFGGLMTIWRSAR